MKLITDSTPKRTETRAVNLDYYRVYSCDGYEMNSGATRNEPMLIIRSVDRIIFFLKGEILHGGKDQHVIYNAVPLDWSEVTIDISKALT